MFLSRGDRDLGVAFQTHPGRQAFISSGSKEPRSALESRRLSLGAHWVDSRESSLLRRLERLVSRPCRRRRPSSLDDGGISGLFSSGGPRYLPEAIVNYIAFLGRNPKSDREIFSLEELAEAFSLAGLNKAPAVFDYTKLRWMNSEHLKMMESEKFAVLAKPFAKIAGTTLEEKWGKLAELIRSRIETLTEIPEKIAFFHELPPFGADMFNNKKSKCTPEIAKSILEELIPRFEALESLTPDTVNPLIEACAAGRGVKLGQPMWAVRISLSGLPATPGGPAEIMEVLGKEESMRRLKAGLAMLG